MRVSIGDVRLYFDIDGPKLVPSGPWMVERPTLLLLHPGPGFDHTVYKVEAGKHLAEFAQVVYIDQRGHGRSDRTPLEQLTLERWADDVLAFCEALSIEKPVVLGHGFGAMVAAVYAARHPRHPSKLDLINPAARVVTERSVAVYERLGGAEAAAVIRPPLAELAQVIYLDHRGAGRSDRSAPEHWNLDTWADDVARFCSLLEIPRPIILGSAFGSFVAMRLAVRHPDLVRGLVLVSAVARHVPSRSIAVLDRLGGAHAGEVASRYYADSSEENFGEYLRVCVPLFTRGGATADLLARMVVNPEVAAYWDGGGSQTVDLREEVRRIGCPTVVLAGRDDPSYTLAGTEELMESLPAEHATLHVFETARYGVFRDAPEAVDVVGDFVRSLGPES